MPQTPPDKTIAPQIELAVRQLDALSILPATAAKYFSKLLQPQASPLDMAEIIEADPAMTAKVFSLAHEKKIRPADIKFSIRNALEKLPEDIVRKAIFSFKLYQTPDNQPRLEFRKQLLLHSLATACCAAEIAKIISPQMEPNLAYSAGLLHNLGALALDQTMPRSFETIVEQAKSQNTCLCEIEQKHLGTDHTILGKRLARKWHLPEQVILAIWLHHSDTTTISQKMPQARIAQIVHLADLTARQGGIGLSGSYEPTDIAERIATSLQIAPQQLEQIRNELPGKTQEKTKLLGLDSQRPQSYYLDAFHTAAAQLARSNAEISQANLQLQTTATHLQFVKDLLLDMDANAAPIDIAQKLAVHWQRFFQTGMVCLYLTPLRISQVLEAVLTQDPRTVKTICLNSPIENPPIPQPMKEEFAVLDANQYCDWLFEQLDVDFDPDQTKIIPLFPNGRAVGAIVFELRYPTKTENLNENFKLAASIAGIVLDMAFATANQQSLAENFAQLLTATKQLPLQASEETAPPEPQPTTDEDISPTPTASEIPATDLLSALAEMAAGAAHELNNPLSVISGRAQLLAESLQDPQAKQMLQQIQQNAAELSGIIDDMMSFAQPPQPKLQMSNIKTIIDEAIQLTVQKQNKEQLDIQIEITEGLEDVFVDSAQVVSALSNVLCNSLESYNQGTGPVKVTAEPEDSSNLIKLQITDSGCGMDAQTLKKATQPFFSARPAGRKRGMGLAHAQRFLHLNNGSLTIQSSPGIGTIVIILLPRS